VPVIALTGATGFVGQTLAAALERAMPDSELRLLIRNPDQRRLPALFKQQQIVPGDLGNNEALEELVEGADTVIHVAAAIAGNSAAEFDQTNVVGTRRLLDQIAIHAAQAHFIQISSLAARHPELSWYAASKRAAEELVATRHAAHSILRPPAVYGPTDPALADFWRWLARGRLIRLGAAAARFSLLHVDDLVEAVVRLVRAGPARRILPLSGPQPEGGWSWRALADRAAAVSEGRVRITPVPTMTLQLAGHAVLAAGRARGRPALLTPGKVRELQHHDWVCDNHALEDVLDWRPTRALEDAMVQLPGWSDR